MQYHDCTKFEIRITKNTNKGSQFQEAGNNVTKKIGKFWRKVPLPIQSRMKVQQEFQGKIPEKRLEEFPISSKVLFVIFSRRCFDVLPKKKFHLVTKLSSPAKDLQEKL